MFLISMNNEKIMFTTGFHFYMRLKRTRPACTHPAISIPTSVQKPSPRISPHWGSFFSTPSVRSCGQQYHTGSPPSSGVESAVTSFLQNSYASGTARPHSLFTSPPRPSPILIKVLTSLRGAFEATNETRFHTAAVPVTQQALKKRTH